MTGIRIEVAGIPAPQGSKRFVGAASGRGRMVESSKAVGPWREAVRAETQRAMVGAAPVDAPVAVDITFTLPRPRAHFGARGLLPSAPAHPAGKPDLDKLLRAALDGLVAGGAIADDARAWRITCTKAYADGVAPGALITITLPEGITP